MKYLLCTLLFFLCSQGYAQGIFEEAIGGESADTLAVEEKAYELNGHLRSVIYGGKVPEKDEAEIKSVYGEAALMLRMRKLDLGDGFAKIRFRHGYEFGDYLSEIDLSEAYVNAYIGRFDFRIGHQIVVWGRADGFNPTDNITPKNMLVRSPDEDDRREANFLLRSFINLQPLRIEAIWVPVYSASVIPTSLVSFPPGIELSEPDYPDANLSNGAIAARLNLEMASFDGSVSYFTGYNPFPGIDAITPNAGTLKLIPKAYKIHTFGGDFSTTLGSVLGIRGEFAYRKPLEDHEEHIYIPNPDLQYVIGGDKEFGDLSLLIQYVGRYVFDYKDLSQPQNPADRPTYEIALKNRMFSSQLYEISHSISLRPALKLMYETLDLEVLGLYNFTTKELFIRPKVSYDIADDLTVTAGGDLYTGPDDTLFGTIDSHLSAIFLELKISF